MFNHCLGKVWLLFFATSIACKPMQEATSSLAFSDGGEIGYSSRVCQSKGNTALRLSKFSDKFVTMTLFTRDYCGSQRVGSRKKASFGLDGSERKPVMIVDGYYGNAPGDKPERDGVRDIMPWVQENFRPVVVPAGASVDELQQVIAADRRANPQDYGADDWVGSITASHGYVDAQGEHQAVKTDITNEQLDPNQVGPTTTSTSTRTIDRQAAILSGVGNNAGTVYCMAWGCQSGAAMESEEFEALKTNNVNPDQNRIFQYSSAGDKLAGFSQTIGEDGQPVTSTPAEQSLVTLMQSADPANGLTVGQFQEKLSQANLGETGGFDISTAYVPTTGIVDTGDPLGTASHYNATTLFSEQGPTVVGPSDAYILPAGVLADTSIPPVATGQEKIDAAEASVDLPPNTFSTGEVDEPSPQYDPLNPYQLTSGR